MEKLHPKAVIFDLGSTLIEYESIPWDELGEECLIAARGFLAGEGFKVPAERDFTSAYYVIRDRYREIAYRDLVEWNVPKAAGDLLNELGIEHDDGLLDRFFDAYYQPVSKQIFVFDDVKSTLDRARECFPVIGLVSNTIFPERAHLGELKRFGIREHFNFTIFSCTFGLRKPHPDIFRKAANCAGYAPSECVYIGDRYLEDVQGPQGIGMPAILKIRPGREYPEDMPDSVRRIDALSEIFDHVEKSVD
ncbi:MAG: HAD family hydrolase [Candidatus Zixiibacteriota bacterium]|nr:MAG: HAD family hydrolase [candidate division Zixibacteria bacterium]